MENEEPLKTFTYCSPCSDGRSPRGRNILCCDSPSLATEMWSRSTSACVNNILLIHMFMISCMSIHSTVAKKYSPPPSLVHPQERLLYDAQWNPLSLCIYSVCVCKKSKSCCRTNIHNEPRESGITFYNTTIPMLIYMLQRSKAKQSNAKENKRWRK